MNRVIIIGGGIAGTSVAEELRKRNQEVEITIIERESNVLYSRVLLPHYVKDKIPREKVFLKSEKWYLDNNIELLNATEAEAIDAKNNFVRISDGRELPYDALVIAAGLSPRLFHADARNITYLYTLDDADNVRSLIAELKRLPENERNAIVYGSGFIACEFANAFKHHDIPFSIVMRGPGFWSRMLSHESQAFLAAHAGRAGVRVYINEPEPALVIHGDDVEAVKLATGETLPCRMIGVGIGAQAEAHLSREAGIKFESGVLADQLLQSSKKGIYTAGDISVADDERVGRAVQYGNWLHALMQGKDLGGRLGGGEAALRPVSQYATELLGCKIVCIGDVAREAADEVRMIRNDAAGCEEHFLRGGKLVGAVLIGEVTRRTELAQRIGTPLE